MKHLASIATLALVFPCLTAAALPGAINGTMGGSTNDSSGSSANGSATSSTAATAADAATNGAAATASPAVRELQAVEDKWSAAFNQRDQYAMELVLSPLFMDVSAAGVFSTRDQQIANLITLDDKTAAVEQQVLAARVLGDVAIATGTYTYRHKAGNTEALDKGVFTHVFEKRRGQWMCVSAQATQVASETPQTKKQQKTRSQAEMPFHIPFFTKGSN